MSCNHMKGFLGLKDPLPKWFTLGWKVDSSSHGTLYRVVGVSSGHDR